MNTQIDSIFDPFSGPELESVYPLSEAQKEIWISSKMNRYASLGYNESLSVHFNGALKTELLTDSIRKLIFRHESLRATISPDGSYMQILQVQDFTVPIQNIGLFNGDEWKKILYKEINTEFDLTNGPLFRAAIFCHTHDEYTLIISAHHIICDGWSLDVLLYDLASIYSAEILSPAPQLKPTHPFSDFIMLQQQPELIATAEQYWKSVFVEEIPNLDLPLDYPRPPIRTYDANLVDRNLDETLILKIKKLAATSQCSLFSVFLTAWAIQIYRLTNQTKIVIGIPIAGQPDAGMEGLVGHCVSLMPILFNINGENSFIERVKQTRTAILDAYEHRHLSFGSLLQKIRVPRDPSRIPLISVSFTHTQKYNRNKILFSGCEVDYIFNPRVGETFELNLNAIESDKGVELLCHFNSRLFKKETIKLRLAGLEALLNDATERPNCPLKYLSILALEESILLSTWNSTESKFLLNSNIYQQHSKTPYEVAKSLEPSQRTSMKNHSHSEIISEEIVDNSFKPENKCIHELFREAAQNSPSATAVICENQSYSYNDLDISSDKISQLLTEAGVKPGDLVGICVERHFGMIATLLGILKSGAAYVPLDPNYPHERLLYMVEDAKLKVIVTEKNTRNKMTLDSDVIFIDIEPDLKGLKTKTNGNIKAQISNENPAYIIYTSGSTGKPKGVIVPHGAVSNFALSMAQKPGISASDTVLALTTISFDIAVLELLVPLTVGARIVIVRRESATDGPLLAKILTSSKATIMQGTPSTWRLLIASGWSGTPRLKALCGGESFPRDLLKELLQKVNSVWNMYGPTETTVWSTCCQLTDAAAPISIGSPIANTYIYILDENSHPVPIGVSGELYIGGSGVAKGYLNREDLTTHRFQKDPFNESPNSRMYATGDLARWMHNGTIECLGRIDSQVKVRGYRIELGEIETVLKGHPLIADAVATTITANSNDVRLVIYYIVKNQSTVGHTDLRQHIQKSLPEYMVPQHFVKIDVVPLTPSGKIDRKALPSPLGEQLYSKELIQPRSEIEKILAEIWIEVLGIKQVSMDDNFFEIGGHSLLAVQMASKILKKTGINFSLATLLTKPTIAEISSQLKSQIVNYNETIENKPVPLSDNNNNFFSHIVPIKSTGNRIPFFCVHCVGGNVLNYHAFVPYLDEDQPLYGLQCQGLDGIAEPFNSLHLMAKSYIDEIRKIQPHGPYRIGGGSMGGLIAFEMAQQLVNLGEPVAMLIMLDSSCPKLVNNMQSNSTGDPEVLKDKRSFLGQAVHSIQCRIDDIQKLIICKQYRMRKCAIPHELRYWYIEQRNLALSASYQPKPYEGVITMFRASLNKECLDPFRGWKSVAKGGMNFFNFACDHNNIIEHEEIAKKLNEVLRKQ